MNFWATLLQAGIEPECSEEDYRHSLVVNTTCDWLVSVKQNHVDTNTCILYKLEVSVSIIQVSPREDFQVSLRKFLSFLGSIKVSPRLHTVILARNSPRVTVVLGILLELPQSPLLSNSEVVPQSILARSSSRVTVSLGILLDLCLFVSSPIQVSVCYTSDG